MRNNSRVEQLKSWFMFLEDVLHEPISKKRKEHLIKAITLEEESEPHANHQQDNR